MAIKTLSILVALLALAAAVAAGAVTEVKTTKEETTVTYVATGSTSPVTAQAAVTATASEVKKASAVVAPTAVPSADVIEQADPKTLTAGTTAPVIPGQKTIAELLKDAGAADLAVADRMTIRTALVSTRLRTLVHMYSPRLAAALQGSRAERLMLYLLMKGGKRYTIFLPTDEALAKFQASARNPGCPRVTLSDELAHHVLPQYLDSQVLRRLTPGTKLPTLGETMIVVKAVRPFIQLEVRSAANELISVATVTRVDRRPATSHSYVVHYLDHVLTAC